MFLKQRNIVFECNIFTVRNTACDASFLKHSHNPVMHFGILHFKNEETLFYSGGPISRYSQIVIVKSQGLFLFSGFAYLCNQLLYNSPTLC